MACHDVIEQNKLLHDGQRQMPKRLLDGDAVFADPSREAKLPRRAGRQAFGPPSSDGAAVITGMACVIVAAICSICCVMYGT